MTVQDGDFRLDTMITRVEDVERRDGREVINAQTDWMAQSDALLGEGAVITLSLREEDTASGAGEDYARRHETALYLKGLGFDEQKILTVTADTAVADLGTGINPIDPAAEIVRPAAFTDAELNAWLEDTRVSLVQAGYTCLGRLPSDVAAYVLERYFK
jgi:hypothetical protein